MNIKVLNQDRFILEDPSRYLSHSSLHGLAILCIIMSALVIGLFSIYQNSFAVFLTFGLFAVIGFFVATTQGDTSRQLFTIVYATSTIAAVALYMIYMKRYGTPYYIGGSDDLAYELWGKAAANSLSIFDYSSIRGTVVQPWHNSVGYVYLISLLYRIGDTLDGFNTMIPRLFNCMCLGLLTTLTFRLAERIGLKRGLSVATALSVGLLPIMVYNTIHTFRDILVALLLFLVVYIWTPETDRSIGNSRLWRWLVTLLLVLLMIELRRFQAIAILLVAFFGALTPSRWVRRRHLLYGYFALATALIVLFLLREETVNMIRILQEAQAGYTEYRLGLSDGLADYVFGAPRPFGYIFRVGYALISPLPTLSRDLERLWLSIGTVIQYMFLPFLGLGIVHTIGDRAHWHLLGAFLLLFGGVAFITFTSRHIVQFLPYAAILAAVGYERYHKYRLPIWVFVSWVGIVLAITYFVLKL